PRPRFSSPPTRPALWMTTPSPTSSPCSNGCSARPRSASSSSPTILNSPSARSAATRCAKARSRRPTCRRSWLSRHGASPLPESRPSSRHRPRRARPSAWARTCGAGVKAFLIATAVIFAAILAADVGVEKYQAMRVRERAARVAALQHLALNRLRGDVQSVADLGDGRYELTTYLENVGGAEPIYVMAPDM